MSVLFLLKPKDGLPLLPWEYDKTLNFQYLLTAGKTLYAVGMNALLMSDGIFVCVWWWCFFVSVDVFWLLLLDFFTVTVPK